MRDPREWSAAVHEVLLSNPAVKDVLMQIMELSPGQAFTLTITAEGLTYEMMVRMDGDELVYLD